MNKIKETFDKTFEVGWGSVILAALSAWYFGYLHSKKETEAGLKPREITIEGQKILIPDIVYTALSKITMK